MEGSRLEPPRLRGPSVCREPGYRLPNICDRVFILRAGTHNTDTVLADLPDGEKENTSTARRDGARRAPARASGRRARGGGRQRGHRGRRRRRHRPPAAHHLRNDHHGVHERVIEQHEPREAVVCEWPRGRPSYHRVWCRRRRLLPDSDPEKTERGGRLQTREKSGENIGNNNRRVCGVLASVFRAGDPGANVRLRGEPGADVAVAVAGLLQLDAEPDHLHGVQPGVPARVPAAAVRAPRSPPPRARPLVPSP